MFATVKRGIGYLIVVLLGLTSSLALAGAAWATGSPVIGHAHVRHGAAAPDSALVVVLCVACLVLLIAAMAALFHVLPESGARAERRAKADARPVLGDRPQGRAAA